jgi:hypothetical protein
VALFEVGLSSIKVGGFAAAVAVAEVVKLLST